MAASVTMAHLKSIGLNIFEAADFCASDPQADVASQRRDVREEAAGARLAGGSAEVKVPPQPSGTGKFKILALHGHAQSASRFKGKMGAITKEVKSLAEFSFVDGPFLVPQSAALEGAGADAFTWVDVNQAGILDNGTCSKYAEVERSFEQILAQDFDAIVAFSLGAAVLVGLLCHPKHGKPLLERLRCVGFFSGFIPMDPQIEGWIRDTGVIRNLPNFHCIGAADEEISARKSDALTSIFEGAAVYRHEGGHVVPAAMRKDFKIFLAGLRA